MSELLHVANLSSSYAGQVQILQDITLVMQPGEKLILVGANGSGKSTLLLHIAGCLTPDTGKVTVEGLEITGQPRLAGQKVGLLFQNPDVQLLMPSVREELLLSLQQSKLSYLEQQNTVEQLVKELHFTHLLDQVPHRLSAGEKQIVALASLLIRKPVLLLLDEPTSNLDPLARRALIDLLCNLKLSMLIATHDLDMALDVGSQVMILNNGKIIAQGLAQELLKDQALLKANRLALPLCMQNR